MKALVVLTGALLLSGCGSATSSGSIAPHKSSAPRVVRATIVNAHGSHPYAFSPARLEVKVGTTVIWTNKSRDYHTVTDVNGKWTSKGFARGHSYSHRFTSVGTFVYTCAFHGYMAGTVVVTKH